MSLGRLKWIAALTPVVVVGVLEYTRFSLGPIVDTWRGRLIMDAVVLIGAVFFYGLLFTLVEQMRGKLERRNRELSTLYDAALDVSSHLALETVLQNVVDAARGLLETRYGALSIYDDEGVIQSFVTSGIDADEMRRIGAPPVGKGLLGVVLHDGERLVTADLESDPRSAGFPAEHPTMRSLLAVPVECRHSPARGNLYLSEKLDGGEFTDEDADTLSRFAIQAANMVDNARLHERVASLAVTEERLRLSREMHDGQAQILAYVNIKAQAVREHLRAGRLDRTREQLDELAAAAREVYADVRDGILALRQVPTEERSLSEVLREYVATIGGQLSLTVRGRIEDVPRRTLDVELQVLRIAQEALANVRKHSRASQVEVDLTLDETGALRLKVVDDGRGFDPAAPRRGGTPRFGLATQRERAEAIEGVLEVDSRRGIGTRVELELPPIS